MATQTFQYASFCGQVRIEFDVNDANWRVSQMRCINNSIYQARATILESGTIRFTAVAPANRTSSWNVTGVQLGWDSINGGIMMGNYVMLARWPTGT